MTQHRIYSTSFASVYPHYVAKAEKKGKTKAQVDQIIRWLTGFSEVELCPSSKHLAQVWRGVNGERASSGVGF
ncbi:DUF2200 family protein [Brevundimonas diminuta]|uniref:DUF2200 family protein n=1 Tax=Brevundimonas diminuta TaxID=293 RepID=UPI003D9A96BD